MFVHLCKTFLSPGEHLLFKGLQEVEKLRKKSIFPAETEEKAAASCAEPEGRVGEGVRGWDLSTSSWVSQFQLHKSEEGSPSVVPLILVFAPGQIQ